MSFITGFTYYIHVLDLTGPNAALCSTLVEQVERKLSEANELIKRQQVPPALPKREEDDDEEGFDETDSKEY